MTHQMRILFVDDEANILAGLRRLIHPHRAEWDSYFCTSGAEALDLMDRVEMDVVVSDMRMPFMDGAAFLTTVRDRHPATLRIILSGYAEQDAILRTVGPAHMYLAKPCEPAALMAALARPLALRRLLSSAGMRTLLASISDLPTPPDLFFKIEAELQSPRASVASVAAIVAQDMAMTAELLKLTNSAYFSTQVRAASALQAVRTLGLDTIQALVLRIGIFRRFDINSPTISSVIALNRYSLAVATLAERIAKAEGANTATAHAAYCTGMLCSIGALVLLDVKPQPYIAALAGADETSLDEAEEAALGANHAALGAYLLGLWGFPTPVVESVAYSLAPSRCLGCDNLLLTAVHAARALGPDFPLLHRQALPAPKLDMPYLCNARKDLRIDIWRGLAQELAEEEVHA